MTENTIVTYYDALAATYEQDRFDNSYGRFIDRCERTVLNKLLTVDEVVADLACGSGRFLNYAGIGIDASKEMLAVAQKKFPGKKLLLCDAAHIPLDTACVDTIISFHFFMHLNPEKMHTILSECNRILKKGGRIIFDIPSKKRRKLFKYKSSDWHGANSLAFKDLTSISGFKIKRTSGILFLPIHRLPISIRAFFTRMDILLSNSFLKEYSSYLIVELEKV
jgi:ubiquinone/menaquinone biosynthesis C-methylase UbiE